MEKKIEDKEKKIVKEEEKKPESGKKTDSKGGRNGKKDNKKSGRGGNNGKKDDKPSTPPQKDFRNGIKMVRDSTNDPKIYIPQGVEASTFASLALNQRLGSSLDLLFGSSAIKEYAPTIPGVMGLYVNRTMTSLDAMKKASLSLFSDVLTKNSSNTPFEHTDFFMHLLAISDLDSIIMFIARALGVLHTYPVYNPYFINGIGKSMGITDLHTAVASDPLRYISRLNVLIARRNRFAIPKNFGYNERGIWVNAHIFSDGDNLNRAQLYIPSMQTYGVWSPRTSNKGSEIIYKPVVTFGEDGTMVEKPLEDWYSLLESMLSVMEMDQDIANMQGYLRKRFDESSLQYVTPISTDYCTTVEFDLVALETISNITPVSLQIVDGDSLVIGQTGARLNTLSQDSLNFTNNIILGASVPGDVNTATTILNCTEPNPTPERVLDISRWIVVGKPVTENVVKPIKETLIKRYVGSTTNIDPDFVLPHDVVTAFVIVTYQPSSGNAHAYCIPGHDYALIARDHLSVAKLGPLVQYFDFHPRVLVWYPATTADMIDEYIYGYMGDLDCFAFVNMAWLNNVNYITTFGIYNIRTK